MFCTNGATKGSGLGTREFYFRPVINNLLAFTSKMTPRKSLNSMEENFPLINVALIIAFEEPGRKPLSVASVHDQELLRQAATVALEEAEREAAAVARESPTLGKLRAAEVVRLRTTLATLIPSLRVCPARAM